MPAHSGQRHVLFIMDRLPRTLGGAENVLLNTIGLLPQDKFRCSLLTFELEPGSVFEKVPCSLHVFPMKRTYDFNAASMAVRLAKLIRSERIDIVHTFFESSDIWGGFVTKMLTSAHLVSSRRDMGILRSSKHRIAYRMMSSFPDKVLTVSRRVREFCIKADRVDPAKVITVYNGVELPPPRNAARGKELRARLGFPDAAQIILTVANVRRVKGLDVLLRAAAKICERNSRAFFVIAGGVLEGDYFQELQNLAQDLNLTGRIRFAGEQKPVQPLLEMSDVFVLPSRSEGFSNALLEAMASELPCIATNVGGNIEAIEDGINGLIVDPEDAGQLETAISSLLEDQERAKEMAITARRTVESRFSPERMISDIVSVYESLPQ
ncbi:MAG TPA: glycosyltransferase family 4 protein [Candidatus Angelobacter sp.]|nr:glycosyltransferase family 4 protein [Candidatus Angelobacter sp.]